MADPIFEHPRLAAIYDALDPDRIAAALGPMTRVIVLSDPHNPTGTLASGESLEALARLAGNAGIPVLVDEVYQIGRAHV